MGRHRHAFQPRELEARVGNALATMRHRKNLSLEAVEAITGFAKSTLTRAEVGRVLPNLRTVLKLAECYECTVSELIGET